LKRSSAARGVGYSRTTRMVRRDEQRICELGMHLSKRERPSSDCSPCAGGPLPFPGACTAIPPKKENDADMISRFDQALALINGAKLNIKSQSGNCIQHVLVARDFLHAVGFPAEAKSVAVYLEAYDGDKMLHSLGCGARHLIGHDPNPERTGWDGHLVVVTNGHMIDPTFYQFRRPAWPWIPDVALLKLKSRPRPVFTFHGAKKGRPVLAGFAQERDSYHFRALWVSTSANDDWKRLPAARRDRRDFIVREMMDEWNRS
jgi:hypothetical protein